MPLRLLIVCANLLLPLSFPNKIGEKTFALYSFPLSGISLWPDVQRLSGLKIIWLPALPFCLMEARFVYVFTLTLLGAKTDD